MAKHIECEHSRGFHAWERIGRPDVWYDKRTKYTTNMAEFDRTMNERHRIANGLIPKGVDVTPEVML